MMQNIFQQLLGAPSVQAAPMPVRRTYDKAMERRARANGFRSAEEMMLWAQRRNEHTGGTIPRASRSTAPAKEQAMAWHPSNILGYILGKTQGALGY